MALTRTKLLRIVARKIQRGAGISEDKSLEIAEAVLEGIDDAMDIAEEGEGFRPPQYEADTLKKIPDLPDPPKAVLPASEVSRDTAKNRLIAMPGDVEFTDAALKTGEKKVIKAIPLTSLQRRKATEKAKEHWTPENLIRALEENFPAEFIFTPNGVREDIKIKVIRNIVQIAGLGLVNVEYKHPAASEDLGSIGDMQHVGVAKLPLVARQPFSIYDETIDIEAALDNIMKQLKGLYAPRRKSMVPMMEDDVMPDMGSPGATDSADVRIRGGWNMIDNPVSAAIDQVRQANKLDSGKVHP